MTDITIRTTDQGEPAVTCEALTRALGYQNKGDMVQLIQRHRAEIETHGFLLRVKENSERRGRPRNVFLLNEKQALLVCMFAHTPKGAEVRRAVVETFAAWRKGTLKPYRPAPVAKIDPSPKMVESFHLRQDHDGLFTVTLQTRRHDVARSVMEACLAPLLA